MKDIQRQRSELLSNEQRYKHFKPFNKQTDKFDDTAHSTASHKKTGEEIRNHLNHNKQTQKLLETYLHSKQDELIGQLKQKIKRKSSAEKKSEFSIQPKNTTTLYKEEPTEQSRQLEYNIAKIEKENQRITANPSHQRLRAKDFYRSQEELIEGKKAFVKNVQQMEAVQMDTLLKDIIEPLNFERFLRTKLTSKKTTSKKSIVNDTVKIISGQPSRAGSTLKGRETKKNVKFEPIPSETGQKSKIEAASFSKQAEYAMRPKQLEFGRSQSFLTQEEAASLNNLDEKASEKLKQYLAGESIQKRRFSRRETLETFQMPPRKFKVQCFALDKIVVKPVSRERPILGCFVHNHLLNLFLFSGLGSELGSKACTLELPYSWDKASAPIWQLSAIKYDNFENDQVALFQCSFSKMERENCALVFGGHLNIGGGFSIMCLNRSLFKVDLLTKEMKEVRSNSCKFPKPRRLHSSAICDNLLYIIGGMDGADQVFDEVWRFNLSKPWFTSLQGLGHGRFRCALRGTVQLRTSQPFQCCHSPKLQVPSIPEQSSLL